MINNELPINGDIGGGGVGVGSNGIEKNKENNQDKVKESTISTRKKRDLVQCSNCSIQLPISSYKTHISNCTPIYSKPSITLSINSPPKHQSSSSLKEATKRLSLSPKSPSQQPLSPNSIKTRKMTGSIPTPLFIINNNDSNNTTNSNNTNNTSPNSKIKRGRMSSSNVIQPKPTVKKTPTKSPSSKSPSKSPTKSSSKSPSKSPSKSETTSPKKRKYIAPNNSSQSTTPTSSTSTSPTSKLKQTQYKGWAKKYN